MDTGYRDCRQKEGTEGWAREWEQPLSTRIPGIPERSKPPGEGEKRQRLHLSGELPAPRPGYGRQRTIFSKKIQGQGGMRGWLAPAAALAGVLLCAAFFAGRGQEMGWEIQPSDLISQAGQWLTEALWYQSYPLEEPDGKPGRGSGETAGEFKDMDPSYENYRAQQTFYAEHEYLAWYGMEESGQEVQEETVPAQETAPALPSSSPALSASLPRPVTGTTYVLEQLADYDFLMKHFYSVHTSTTAGRDLMDAKALLSRDLTLDREAPGPQILVYHTHSQEAFAGSGPGETIVEVGDYLTELLEGMGYQVYHDTSPYDMKGGSLDRNRAYNYALEGITKILEEHPSIQVVLDIHRDGVAENLKLVTEIDGKPTAQVMFFNGLSQTPEGPIDYLNNPYREENLAFSLNLKLGAEAYYPGYARKIYLKGLRYNLHLRPRSALIEVGAQTNTYQEARNAMEPLSQLLDMVLQGK